MVVEYFVISVLSNEKASFPISRGIGEVVGVESGEVAVWKGTMLKILTRTASTTKTLRCLMLFLRQSLSLLQLTPKSDPFLDLTDFGASKNNRGTLYCQGARD